MTDPVHRPTSEADVAALVSDAFARGAPLAIRGGGSKAALLGPIRAQETIALEHLTGITLHEPAELVISARAGTPLEALTAALDQHGQMLPFEPPDWRSFLGAADCTPTVGGMVATNASGPRRLIAGACRDSLIGARFVNGMGTPIKSGGRVMKNVTGYDLARLMAGSWGTLGILTEVTFKLLPRPETSASLVFAGLDEARAVDVMAQALASPFEISAAAHLPARGQERAKTLLRLENFATSIAYRSDKLISLLRSFGAAERLDEAGSVAAWRAIADLAPLPGDAATLLRLNIAPSKAPALIEAIRSLGGEPVLLDQGGGLVYVSLPPGPAPAQQALAAVRAAGGHGLPLRADAQTRAALPWFGRPGGPTAALAERVRASFDPAGILNPGFAER